MNWQRILAFASNTHPIANCYSFKLHHFCFFVEFEGKCPAEGQPGSPQGVDVTDTENLSDSALQVFTEVFVCLQKKSSLPSLEKTPAFRTDIPQNEPLGAPAVCKR